MEGDNNVESIENTKVVAMETTSIAGSDRNNTGSEAAIKFVPYDCSLCEDTFVALEGMYDGKDVQCDECRNKQVGEVICSQPPPLSFDLRFLKTNNE